MKSKEYISLQKMIEYIDKSIGYTEGYTFEEFCNDSKTIDATVFIISQSSATWRVMIPPAFTWAKSRTRRSIRLAMRGVPRDRLAISMAPASSIGTSKIPAERLTMSASSSGV